MSRRSLLLLGLMVCTLIYYYISSRQNELQPRALSPGTQPGSPPTQPAVAREEDWAVSARQDQARVEGLARLESLQELRARAAAQRPEECKVLQARAAPAWTALLKTNRDAFIALSQQAAASPKHVAHCTLCDGTGMLGFCVLCEHTGKCVRCGGTGRVDTSAWCPACLGTGKCTACFGTGKMACPFCDDGVIEARTPFPPHLIPLH